MDGRLCDRPLHHPWSASTEREYDLQLLDSSLGVHSRRNESRPDHSVLVYLSEGRAPVRYCPVHLDPSIDKAMALHSDLCRRVFYCFIYLGKERSMHLFSRKGQASGFLWLYKRRSLQIATLL